jgi:thymidine kinase
MATIEVFTGPMFSGKTTGLLDRVHYFRGAGVPVLLVKHASDMRYDAGSTVTTHSGIALACHPAHDVTDIAILTQNNPDAKVVAIDEVQFFEGDTAGWAVLARSVGISVIVAGLDRESSGKTFGPMGELLAQADVVHKLKTDCKCGLLAHQTRRRPDAPEGMVGGSERYESVCWGCYYRTGV